MRDVDYRRIGRDALVVVGIVAAAYCWLWMLSNGSPVDAHYYWAADPSNLYPHPELAEKNGFNYSPAFYLAVWWGHLVSFEVFAAVWRAILLATLVYLAGPFTIFVIFAMPVASEINAGNIQLLLALAVVLGFRYPATWSFVLLTKVSPGVGLLWFALRREWRALSIVAIVTLAVAAASWIVLPTQWPGWIALITSGREPSVWPYYLPLWVRLPPAIACVVIAAVTGKRWLVVVAATLALPVYYPLSSSMLVGVLPFLRDAIGRWLDARAQVAMPELVA